MLYPALLARNRVVTRILAKQAKTKKVKSNFINFINFSKSSKEYSVVFLVEGEKFNLGEKI